jgi:hypothetical protein
MEYCKTKTGKENITQNNLLQLWGHPAQSRCLKSFFSSKSVQNRQSHIFATNRLTDKIKHAFVIFPYFVIFLI